MKCSTVTLEPEGRDQYTVRNERGRAVGFLLYASNHAAWHAFDDAGEFVGPAESKLLAASLIVAGE
jgi:hypothetical protein